MGEDVTSLYHQCIARKNDIDHELDSLTAGQRLPIAKRQRLQGLEREFGDAFATFEREIDAKGQSLPGGKAKWDRYRRQLADDKTSIRASLQPHQIEDVRQQTADRESLLGQRDARTQDDRAKLLTERSRLRDVDRQLDEMLEIGQESRQKLQEQNETLRNAKSRMINVVEAIGRSTGLVKRIDRRHWEDKILVYAGMFASVTLFFGLYIYFKWWRS
ncbi:unnamed protein product [Amoebophrya sp. A25]|nr:unnamed protein product [Amoebophrya sp. A25]|eukprot:GSA25T00011723001.1